MSPATRHMDVTCLTWCTEKNTASLLGYSGQQCMISTWPWENIKCKLRDASQNNRSVIIQTVKAMKDKRRLRDSHRWEDSEETHPLKAMWDPGLDPGTEKALDEKTSWTLNKHSLTNTLIAMFFVCFSLLRYWHVSHEYQGNRGEVYHKCFTTCTAFLQV